MDLFHPKRPRTYVRNYFPPDQQSNYVAWHDSGNSMDQARDSENRFREPELRKLLGVAHYVGH